MNNYLVIFLVFLISNDSCISENQSDNGFLDIMAKTLNKSMPKYKRKYDKKGFYVKDSNQPINFFVYNLVNTDKNSYSTSNKIVFKNEGIYHFCPVRAEFSFSHIAVIKENKMKIFSYINCDNEGDSIKDVLENVILHILIHL